MEIGDTEVFEVMFWMAAILGSLVLAVTVSRPFGVLAVGDAARDGHMGVRR